MDDSRTCFDYTCWDHIVRLEALKWWRHLDLTLCFRPFFFSFLFLLIITLPLNSSFRSSQFWAFNLSLILTTLQVNWPIFLAAFYLFWTLKELHLFHYLGIEFKWKKLLGSLFDVILVYLMKAWCIDHLKLDLLKWSLDVNCAWSLKLKITFVLSIQWKKQWMKLIEKKKCWNW